MQYKLVLNHGDLNLGLFFHENADKAFQRGQYNLITELSNKITTNSEKISGQN